ncbi:hypothetical protein FISHEDRAFT_65988 [Fistulina hepatica ATCC 64428]|uniref:GST N-terminal domain-containing protein n=1 Tax=Fistulina hepatica ATCC 64428 TaxID=1128425 RepID=A0A0D7AA64_9AGAR|nr:hypothetical protein FISHEDRAFT_65988 [Fistulina hepatica ATCC 64428]
MTRHPNDVPLITLYDVPSPSSTPQTWLPNIWRVRLVLNFKRLRYRTEWVEFPDIEQKLTSIGAPPSGVRPDGRPIFTLPVLVDHVRNPHAPVKISHADKIAEYLESAYPARSIFPEGSRALQFIFVHHIERTFARPLLTLMVPISHQQLPPRSQSHFPVSGGDGAAAPAVRSPATWADVKGQFDFLASMLDKNAADGDGVVVMGRELSYADFVLCAMLLWIEKLSPNDVWQQVRMWNEGRWWRLWDRCGQYMEVC